MLPRVSPFFDRREFQHAWACKIDRPGVEEELAKILGVKHVLLLPYGRMALWIYFKALGILDKEVIIPAYDCRVVPSLVIASRNRPVFVDSADTSFNIDLAQILPRVSRDTAAIVLTSMYGQTFEKAAVDELRESCPNIPLIADQCLALYQGKESYSLTNDVSMSFLSFGLTKQLTMLRGGAFTTNDTELFKKVQAVYQMEYRPARFLSQLELYFMFFSSYLAFSEYAYNILYMLSEKTSLFNAMKGSEIGDSKLLPKGAFCIPGVLQFGILKSQLEKYEENFQLRSLIIERYIGELKPLVEEGVFEVPIQDNSLSHFPILSSKRDSLAAALLESRIHATNVFRQLPFEQSLVKQYVREPMPRAEYLRDNCLLLPLYAQLTDGQQGRVIECVKKWRKKL